MLERCCDSCPVTPMSRPVTPRSRPARKANRSRQTYQSSTKTACHPWTCTSICARTSFATFVSSFGGLDQSSRLRRSFSTTTHRASATALRIYTSLARPGSYSSQWMSVSLLTCGKGCNSMLQSFASTSRCIALTLASPVYTFTAASSLWTLPDLKWDFWIKARKFRHLDSLVDLLPNQIYRLT